MKYDTSKKPTRGAIRTLAAFSQAMFDLLPQKSFESISINEICTQTNYPRATFYNYFDDKYDLLVYCWSLLGEYIHLEEATQMNPEERLHIYFDRIYDFSLSNQEKIRLILKTNPQHSYMFGSFRAFMNEQMRLSFQQCAHLKQYALPREMVADHYSNTLLLVIDWCLWRESVKTKEEARKYLDYLIGHLEEK